MITLWYFLGYFFGVSIITCSFRFSITCFCSFFEGKKSMDGCVDGNCNVPELRICEFCLFPIEDVSGGQTFAPSVV